MCVRLVEADGRSLVYTADTGYSEELAAFASGADLLLLECSFYRTTGTAKHLDLVQAMKVVELANPKRVVLTHLYSDWDGVDLVGEANKLWTGEVIEATDGLRLEV
jgi:ribonuclease BN (tRNA processing enzyme)